MLRHAPPQIIRNTSVNNSVVLIRHAVNEILFVHFYESKLGDCFGANCAPRNDIIQREKQFRFRSSILPNS